MPTIAAIATAPGAGGIGIVRVSGPGAKGLLEKIFQPGSRSFEGFRPWTLHHGHVLNSSGQPLDDCLAVYMPGPATFTGEDVAEFQCHGGRLLLGKVLETVLELGARAAAPGEFTRRAFMNGRIDLTRAEAVAELIAARSPIALDAGLHRLSGHLAEQIRHLKEQLDELRALFCANLDFSDEEIPNFPISAFDPIIADILTIFERLLANARRVRFFQEGLRIVMVGPVNAGKSSLFNALCGKMRALVSDRPGTTRDYLEQELDFNGLPVSLVDTAGLRSDAGADELEALGIAKSRELLKEGGMIWLVLDAGNFADAQNIYDLVRREAGDKPLLLVWNKCDLSRAASISAGPECHVSALTGENLDELPNLVFNLLPRGLGEGDGGVAPNARQSQLLSLARDELLALKADLEAKLPFDICASHLDAAAGHLDSILGISCHDELLDKIFSRFCIGK